MKYSEVAFKVLLAKELGVIKSNALFWSKYFDIKKIEKEIEGDRNVKEISDVISKQILREEIQGGFICPFDKEFPAINNRVKNSEKPALLFYKGDLSLLNNLNNNVAVIGLVDPSFDIEEREVTVTKRLVESGLTIVSGLAKGCDAIAHEVCVNSNGRTIAILPSQISKISPAVNKRLAENIVSSGGLLISEYYSEPKSRNEAISRYIERDRLQAMFSKAVILIASYRKGEGDSGARHAIKAAQKYGVDTYAMFNVDLDTHNPKFGLNEDLLKSNVHGIKILHHKSIEYIKSNTKILNYETKFEQAKLQF